MSPDIVAEHERAAKEFEEKRLATIEENRIKRETLDKRYAENTVSDTLASLEDDGWFVSDRRILKSGTAYRHVLEHALMPYALVYFYGDFSVPRKTDRVRWQKCQLVETQIYEIELLDRTNQ
jgi:hypothetical protein